MTTTRIRITGLSDNECSRCAPDLEPRTPARLEQPAIGELEGGQERRSCQDAVRVPVFHSSLFHGGNPWGGLGILLAMGGSAAAVLWVVTKLVGLLALS